MIPAIIYSDEDTLKFYIKFFQLTEEIILDKLKLTKIAVFTNNKYNLIKFILKDYIISLIVNSVFESSQNKNVLITIQNKDNIDIPFNTEPLKFITPNITGVDNEIDVIDLNRVFSILSRNKLENISLVVNTKLNCINNSMSYKLFVSFNVNIDQNLFDSIPQLKQTLIDKIEKQLNTSNHTYGSITDIDIINYYSSEN